MITAIVAWANAKYDASYELIFLGTFIIDIEIIIGVIKVYLEKS